MQNNKINFFNTDCISFMKTKIYKFYNLAIVDPPYGIKSDKLQDNRADYKKWGYKKYKESNWDTKIPSKEYWDELFRVSINQIVFGGNYMTKFLPPSMGWIVWNKMQSEKNFLADGEMAWTSFDKAMRIFNMNRGQSESNNKKYGGRFHPTQKPVKLYRWILQKYAKQNDRILDTHGGSMSSAIACDIENFNIDICEIDKYYFEKGIKRYDDYKSQIKLF